MAKQPGWGSSKLQWKWIPIALLAAVIVAGFFQIIGNGR